MKSDKSIILHLSLIDGIGAATIQHIINTKPATMHWHDCYQLTVADWQALIKVNRSCAQKLVTGLGDCTLLEQELLLIGEHQVNWMSILDPEYPHLLKQIHYPPAILYWHGKHPGMYTSLLAMVGSRQADRYAQRVINMLVPSLVAQNITIVSGGALGADAMAHRAALDAAGTTIAVLGSGLLRWYPLQNNSLFEQIKKFGTLLSIFPLNTQAHAGNFPARNRVIAGLSFGCVVVQAAEQSGARITANFALEQGREVFAIPGLVDDPLSAGCHCLIQQGAKLVRQASDIFDELPMLNSLHIQNKEEYTQVTLLSHDGKLSSDSLAHKLLQTCRHPINIDELVEQLGAQHNRDVVQSTLFDLALSGHVQQDFMGNWFTL